MSLLKDAVLFTLRVMLGLIAAAVGIALISAAATIINNHYGALAVVAYLLFMIVLSGSSVYLLLGKQHLNTKGN